MTLSPVLTRSVLALFAAAAVQASEPVRPFPGSSPTDLTRGLPATAFQPRLLPEREAIESYSLWIQLEDGASLLVSLLISNMGRPRQPAVAVSLYPASGPRLEANLELPPDALSHSATRVQAGRNSLEQLTDGRYRLRLAVPLKGGGDLSADLTLAPTVPPYRRGEGRVELGSSRRFFELMVLFPRARVEGQYTYGGTVRPARGMAYGDHTAQNVWPHHIANRWFNFRFFSDELVVACTSFVTPPRFGTRPVAHVVVADASRLLFATDQPDLQLRRTARDPESSYLIPQEVHTVLTGDGMRIELNVPTPRPLERLYLLQDLNPLLRAFLRTFIARPYTYRYRVPAVARVTQRDGSSSRVNGTFLAELIFVNE